VRHGWETKKLGEVLQPVDTVDPTKAPTKRFRYIDVSSVSNETFEVIEAAELLGKDAPSRARRKIKSGDVIFATIRPTLKRIAIVPPNLDGEVCSTGYFVFRPQPFLDHRFLYYHLFTDQFLYAMAELQTGASYPAVNDTQVRLQEISYPSLGEQQRIVAVLDKALTGLATATANAEKNLKNARELFESHLRSSFSARQDQVKLQSLATEITDGDHSPPPKAASGVPFITISNIVKETSEIDFSDTFFVPKEYFQSLKPNKKPQVGDILYTVTGATLGIPVLVKNQKEFCFQRHIGLIRPKPDVDSRWLSYALASPYVFAQATIGSTGAAQKTVSLSVLRNIEVPKLSLLGQRACATKLDDLADCRRRLAVTYRRKIESLVLLKQSILQKAFSGELTLPPRAVKEAAE
jgi:type I restriction enzyme, S subunit